MKLFEFLKRASKEGFGIQIKYFDSTSSVEVHVDAFYEKWIVSFDRSGDSDGYMRYKLEVDNDDPEELNGLFGRPQKAWEDAAKDLGITFIGPFRFGAEDDWCCVTGLLPDFGSEAGTLLITRKDDDEVSSKASATNYYCSYLSPYSYDQYDRDRFMDTLNDWGWFGKGKPPAWFKGKITSV
jgi:hypothetical protein